MTRPAGSGAHGSAESGDRDLVDLVRLVRWRRRQVGLVQAEDVQRVGVADPPAGVAHRLADPARLALALALRDVGLPPAAVREDQPDERGADHRAEDQQPPVELAVHGARVQGDRPASRRSPVPLAGTSSHRIGAALGAGGPYTPTR